MVELPLLANGRPLTFTSASLQKVDAQRVYKSITYCSQLSSLSMKLLFIALPFLLFQDLRKDGNPLDHLPSNIQMLTHFGERADFSPDNKHIAFMTKSFGDAMTFDLETRTIRCLTCNVPGAAFLRVMHLSNGDYILIGPDHFENISISRARDNELWYLRNEKGAKPIKLNHKLNEGAAVSKTQLTLAFTLTHEQESTLKEGSSQLLIYDIDASTATPKLVHKRIIHESPDRSCVLEAQDFYDANTKLTFTCYEPQGRASVMSIDLKTSKVTNMSNHEGYSEVEGIIPDTQFTLVESDRQCEQLGCTPGSGNIDIWKLKLDGTGKDFVRLTHFNDYKGGKASNPVVSTDGKHMAFQLANTADPAGVGYGILLFSFE
jgi:Tol biopolymer transport system component